MSNFNEVEKIIGYDFKNKSLLMQAFMRRSYGLESRSYTNNEVLEFIGDRVIDYVLVRCMIDQYSDFYGVNGFENLFQCCMHEGTLNKQLVRYKEGDYLASRVFDLGLNKHILCGKGDEVTFKAAGDVMEALIASVALDCDWDYKVLDEVVESLLDVHLEKNDIEQDSFIVLNTWHRRHFLDAPIYTVTQNEDNRFISSVTIKIPDSNDPHTINGKPELTRSRARTAAAQAAYDYLNAQGIWMNLKESLLEPNLENAINQLQELYQKGYIMEPGYEILREGSEWEVTCTVGTKNTLQTSRTKIFAKKKAAYNQMLRILEDADFSDERWKIFATGPLADELLLFYKQNPEAESEVKYEFILKKMNKYDIILANGEIDRVGYYHSALQYELCRQLGVREEAFAEWKRKGRE